MVAVYSAKKRTPDDATEPGQWDEEVVNAVRNEAMDVTFTSGTATFPCLE